MTERKIVAIIQARMSSTRLPSKIMERIGDKSMIEILVKRLQNSSLLDEIIIATTTNPIDDRIIDLANLIDIRTYRGSENDVLSRYVGAARFVHSDIIVRVTADNPLTDPGLMDRMIKHHLDLDSHYTFCSDSPVGISTEIINSTALSVANSKASSASEKEHVTLYIRRHPDVFRVTDYRLDINSRHLRLTLDTIEDLSLIREIFKEFGDLVPITLEDLIVLFQEKPDLIEINRHIQQKVV